MPKIIFEVDELSDENVKDLRYLFADALDDFIRSRNMGDARAYVDGRYKDGEGAAYPAGERREKKIAEVQRRLDLAKSLHNAALDFKIEK